VDTVPTLDETPTGETDMSAYQTKIAELEEFQERFANFQGKIMDLQRQIDVLEATGGSESFEYEALCIMQGGLQQAMQKEHDNFFGA
jgi:hypothetical protein